MVMICFISQDILFWTLSTIIQSMVAFVALLGMVAVYKIQNIERDKESIAENMCKHLYKHWDQEILSYSSKEIILKTHSLSATNNLAAQMNPEMLKRASSKFSEKDKYLTNIKRMINDFFLLTISLIIFSLVLLPMSSYLECNNYSLPILVVIILWSISSLYLGYKLAKKLI